MKYDKLSKTTLCEYVATRYGEEEITYHHIEPFPLPLLFESTSPTQLPIKYIKHNGSTTENLISVYTTDKTRLSSAHTDRYTVTNAKNKQYHLDHTIYLTRG